MQDAATLQIGGTEITHSTCVEIVTEEEAKAKFIDDIFKRCYCDEDFKERLKNNQNKVSVELQYFPYYDLHATVTSLHYTKREHFYYTTGYHGTVSGNTVTIHEDIDSDSYDVEVDKDAYDLKGSIYADSFSNHNLTNIVYYDNIIREYKDLSQKCASNGGFLDITPVVDDDFYEEVKKEIVFSENQLRDNGLTDAVKEYIRPNGRDPHFSATYTCHIYWCPVYKITFENAYCYIHGLTGEFICKIEYPRSKEYDLIKQHCAEEDSKLKKKCVPLYIFLILFNIAELVTLMSLSIPNIMKYQGVMEGGDRGLYWFFIVLSFIVWFVYNIIGLKHFYSDWFEGNIITYRFIEYEKKPDYGYKKFDYKKESKSWFSSNFLSSLIMIGIPIVHFGLGFLIFDFIVDLENADKLQEAASMLFHMFV